MYRASEGPSSSSYYNMLAKHYNVTPAEPPSNWEALSDAERAYYVHEKRRTAAYKSSLCRYWKKNGKCHYGETCRFAHGIPELRAPPPSHPKYKTQLCKNYTYEGRCHYGKRCEFIHRPIESFATLGAPSPAPPSMTAPGWVPVTPLHSQSYVPAMDATFHLGNEQARLAFPAASPPTINDSDAARDVFARFFMNGNVANSAAATTEHARASLHSDTSDDENAAAAIHPAHDSRFSR